MPKRLRSLLLLPLAALLLAALLLTASPAHARSSPHLSVGIGDQKLQMFSDARLQGDLGIKKVRRVVPWDAMNVGFEREEVDAWVSAALGAGLRPLISFGHSRLEGRRRVAPTTAQFVAAFKKFRARYPTVREFATWNEPNLCGEPLCHKPALAARYFDALTATCRHCTILAAEVLDGPTMAAWVKTFLRHAKTKPKVWGLHNYLDANRRRTTGTRRLLELTDGQVWFTETGGIVRRRTAHKQGGFPETVAHAGVATRWIFDRLVKLSPRITRVYLYHWNPGTAQDSWDSALLNLDDTERTSYRVLRNRLRALREQRRAAARHRSPR